MNFIYNISFTRCILSFINMVSCVKLNCRFVGICFHNYTRLITCKCCCQSETVTRNCKIVIISAKHIKLVKIHFYISANCFRFCKVHWCSLYRQNLSARKALNCVRAIKTTVYLQNMFIN